MRKTYKNKRSSLIFTIGLVIGTLLLIGCSDATSLEDKLIPVDMTYVIGLIENSEEAFVYIASPTCPACTDFQPIVQEFLNNENRELYYFDTDAAFLEKPDELVNLMEALNVTGTPTILYLDGGEVQASFDDSLTLESLTAFFDSLK